MVKKGFQKKGYLTSRGVEMRRRVVFWTEGIGSRKTAVLSRTVNNVN